MKLTIIIAALLLTGCASTTISDRGLYGDSKAGQAAAIIADTAVSWEIWKLMGHVK